VCPRRAAHVFGTSVDAAIRGVGFAPNDPDLGREDRAFATIAQRPAHQPLVLAAPVHVGGVDQCDPELERAMNRPNRLRLGDRLVEFGHPHAAQTDRAGPRAVRAELAIDHVRRLR
jgi:hypothetical protein